MSWASDMQIAVVSRVTAGLRGVESGLPGFWQFQLIARSGRSWGDRLLHTACRAWFGGNDVVGRGTSSKGRIVMGGYFARITACCAGHWSSPSWW